MTTTKKTLITAGEITNLCTCTAYDENTGDYKEASECFGYCWSDSVAEFGEATMELRHSNETDWWSVENLRLWNGDISGHFKVDKVEEMLIAMTVRSEWRMHYEVYSDRVEYSLSHHDAPTGSETTLRPVTEQQRRERGL
jgi:hypothetical protein